MMEIAFIRPRNITFDRLVFFSRKQKKGETVEQFYSIVKELAENCDFENREEAIIRDIFITNMLDDDIQRELLRDTVEPGRALSIAVNMEMGNQNQQRISSNNGATGSTVNTVHQFNRFRGAGVRGPQSSRTVTNRASIGQCRGCVKSGHLHIVRFAPQWVRNVITVVCKTISLKFVVEDLILQETLNKLIALTI